jgi:peroxiredoxin
MQRKYGKDGFVAVSVSVDDAQKKDDVEEALKFLRAQDAEFTNLLLDESDDVWPDKLGSNATPFIFVFDRDGRIAQKFEGKKATYEDNVEPLVQKLLNK